jgi:hypothetical protein
VLRIKYGPGEKSVMHGHPASIAVFLNEGHTRFTYPGGKVEDIKTQAGQVLHFDKGVRTLRTNRNSILEIENPISSKSGNRVLRRSGNGESPMYGAVQLLIHQTHLSLRRCLRRSANDPIDGHERDAHLSRDRP